MLTGVDLKEPAVGSTPVVAYVRASDVRVVTSWAARPSRNSQARRSPVPSWLCE